MAAQDDPDDYDWQAVQGYLAFLRSVQREYDTCGGGTLQWLVELNEVVGAEEFATLRGETTVSTIVGRLTGNDPTSPDNEDFYGEWLDEFITVVSGRHIVRHDYVYRVHFRQHLRIFVMRHLHRDMIRFPQPHIHGDFNGAAARAEYVAHLQDVIRELRADFGHENGIRPETSDTGYYFYVEYLGIFVDGQVERYDGIECNFGEVINAFFSYYEGCMFWSGSMYSPGELPMFEQHFVDLLASVRSGETIWSGPWQLHLEAQYSAAIDTWMHHVEAA